MIVASWSLSAPGACEKAINGIITFYDWKLLYFQVIQVCSDSSFYLLTFLYFQNSDCLTEPNNMEKVYLLKKNMENDRKITCFKIAQNSIYFFALFILVLILLFQVSDSKCSWHSSAFQKSMNILLNCNQSVCNFNYQNL